LGRYPPGSLVELNDGRWVLSMSGVRAPEDFELPLCMVARNANGTFPDKDIELDLASEKDLYVQSVVRPQI